MQMKVSILGNLVKLDKVKNQGHCTSAQAFDG